MNCDVKRDERWRRAARRGWRRRVVVSTLGALLSSVVLSISPAWSATKTAHASSAVVTVRLEQPTGMVAASDGLLFIADQSLNQVLVRLPTGHLQSIAGNGHAGFSGDGGLATQGELDQPGALALAPNGIMYVADVGNHRIRALLPHDRIATFAGDGATTASAFHVGVNASHVAIWPSGLAVAPDGRIWVTSGNDVLELSASGIIIAVVDVATYAAGPVPYQPCDPESLVVNAEENLFIGCSTNHQLIERSSNGHDTLISRTYRPHDFPGLALTKGGALVMANHESLVGVVGSASFQLFGFEHFGDSKRFVPSGVAIATNGTIYVDSQSGDGFTFGAGLAKITPGGADVLLRFWKES